MMKKWLILGLAWLLVACGTRDEVAAATPIPPSHTPVPTVTPIPPTQTPTRLYATITRQPTATYTPSPTSTATPTPTLTPTPIPLPSAHLLFRRDDQLWDWFPTTNETTLLAEDVERVLQAEGDVLVFIREIPTESSFSLVVYHLPTHIEQEIIRLPAYPFDVQLSPDGVRLGLVANQGGDYPLFTVYLLQYDQTTFLGAELIFSYQSDSQWIWPYDYLLWATPTQFSWNDPEGILLVDLNETNPSPQVVISPSNNQYVMPSLTPFGESSLEYTKYTSGHWSPDGRYLLVVEYFFEEGQFRVIDRITGNSFVLPGLGVGEISDEALWINETQLVYLDLQGEISLWETTPESETLMTKVKSTPLPELTNWWVEVLWLDSNSQLCFRYKSNALMVWDTVSGELFLLKELDTIPIISEIVWSPDRNWILVVANEVILVGLENQEPIYLDAILGENWGDYWQWYSYPAETEMP